MNRHVVARIRKARACNRVAIQILRRGGCAVGALVQRDYHMQVARELSAKVLA